MGYADSARPARAASGETRRSDPVSPFLHACIYKTRGRTLLSALYRCKIRGLLWVWHFSIMYMAFFVPGKFGRKCEQFGAGERRGVGKSDRCLRDGSEVNRGSHGVDGDNVRLERIVWSFDSLVWMALKRRKGMGVRCGRSEKRQAQ